MNRLAADIARCEDARCPLAERCLRFLERESGPWVEPTMRAGETPCLYWLRADL